ELAALIERVTINEPRAHWQRLMDEAGVPASPINRYDEALAAPQTIARGLVAEVEHPRVGRHRLVASPIHLGRTSPGAPAPAPLLGQHSRELLTGAGYSAAEVDEMVAAGAVGEP